MNPNIIAAFVTFLAAATQAHHATSTNFTQELISVDGVIEQIRYQNPHSSILIKHTSGKDEGTYWLIETGAKTTLHRQGINLESLAIGEKITATGLKGRRQYTMYLRKLVFEDGSVFTGKGLSQ